MTRLAIVLALILGISACAETEYVLRYGTEEMNAAQVPRWPQEPEVPRYMWFGELTGEGNYKVVEPVDRSQVQAALAWLVGLALPNAAPRRLARPYSVLVDERGRILVTDVGLGSIFVFDEANGELQIWERAGNLERFQTPIGIAPTEDGGFLVTDADYGAVIRLDAEGKPLGAFGADILERPTGIARDPQRRVTYVADSAAHDIKVFDDAGNFLDVIGARGTRVGEFNGPTLLQYRDNRLYVTDTLNTRIQVLDVDGAVLRSFGEQGLMVGNLVRPKGVAVDDDGYIYVVESLYDHLLVFDGEGRLMLPIGGEGDAPGKFHLPSGVTIDQRNRVFVADTFNSRIAIFQYLGE